MLSAKKVCDLCLWAASMFAIGTYDDGYVCIWLKYIVLDCSPVSLLNRVWAAQLTAANTDRKQGLWQLF